MTAPRVYMAGAVEALPDLGTGWRRDLAAELVAAGCEPVWPTADLLGLASGTLSHEQVTRWWANLSKDWASDPTQCDPPLDDCLTQLSLSDVVLVRWCSHVGAGTRAEIAYAVAIGLPVVVWFLDDCPNPPWSITHNVSCERILGDVALAVSSCKLLGAARVAQREAHGSHTSPLLRPGVTS